MTLCIAAIALGEREQRRIILVSDYMLSFGEMEMDNVHLAKASQLGDKNRWGCLFSGLASVAEEVSGAVKESLKGKDDTPSAVMRAYEREFQAARRKRINDELLSPYGLDLERFIKEGRASFGNEQFGRIKAQIANYRLDTEFLIAGFTESGAPKMFTVYDPGRIEMMTHQGFHAIGNGHRLAYASLIANFNQTAPISEVLYRLAEAKFRGESASGVGKKTLIAAFDRGGRWALMFPAFIDKWRAHWEDTGKAPLPIGLSNESLVAIFKGQPHSPFAPGAGQRI